MIKTYLWLAILSITIISCNKNESVHQNFIYTDFQINIYDSISVNSLGEILLTDYNPNTELITGYDIYKEINVILNKNGEIVSSFDRQYFDNEGYGNRFGGSSFYSDSSLMILGVKGYYEYDFNGNLLSYMTHPFANKTLPLNFKFNLIKLEKKSTNYIIGMTGPNNMRSANDPDFYKEMRWVSITDYNNNSYIATLKYEKNSLYLDGNSYYYKAPIMTYSKQDETIIVVYPYDLSIYLYEFDSERSQLALINTQDTRPDFFGQNEYLSLLDRENDSDRTRELLNTNSFYSNIFVTDSLIILEYETRKQTSAGGIQNSSYENDKPAKKYLQFFTMEGKVAKDIELPAESNRTAYVFDDGEIWLRKETITEEDQITFYKARLISR